MCSDIVLKIKNLTAALITIAILIPITSVDAAGSLPKRIISLTPATTEILFALGLGDEIIAVSSYCTWPLDCLLYTSDAADE